MSVFDNIIKDLRELIDKNVNTPENKQVMHTLVDQVETTGKEVVSDAATAAEAVATEEEKKA